jgi:hypothetical protein
LPNSRAGALIGPAWQPQRRVEALVALQRARGDAGRPGTGTCNSRAGWGHVWTSSGVLLRASAHQHPSHAVAAVLLP